MGAAGNQCPCSKTVTLPISREIVAYKAFGFKNYIQRENREHCYRTNQCSYNRKYIIHVIRDLLAYCKLESVDNSLFRDSRIFNFLGREDSTYRLY